MANQWALLIGINQYKALQPLMYAQSDAMALRNFFVDELGVPVNNCTLLTDLSATIEPHAYTPSRKEIDSQLKILCQEKVQPGDLLWVFFSGCGLAEGGQDYWMTLDSDPMKPSETAIALSSVFETVSKANTDQIIMVMDMNRSQGAIGHRNIGSQTLTLANDFNIPTFLSCQPDQFSHETMYVRHGLFTKALLEGLRYHGCVTVSQLAAYLGDRVPELCEHHCRPPQNPVVVIPSAQKFMMVVPSDGIAHLSVTESAAADLGIRAEDATAPDIREDSALPSALLNPPLTNQPAVSAPISGKVYESPDGLDVSPRDSGTEAGVSREELFLPETRETQRPGAIVVREPEEPSDEEDTTGLEGLLKWGALAAAVAFLAGVFFRYQPVLFRGGERTAQTDAPVTVTPTESATTDTPVTNETATGETATDGTTTDAPSETDEGDDGNTPGEALFPEAIDATEAGETALQRAEEAIAANRYGEARAWLSQVPPELQDATYQSLLEQASGEIAQAAVRNQNILNTARQIIQPTSASKFSDAIEQARQVPPEDPYYEQAQTDIARWSQVILDLAEGRAAGGNLSGAIAAAKLVPEDQPALFDLARQRIAVWEEQSANQQLIQQAQNSLRPGQASSFNEAIRTLAQITPDQPSYATAQARMSQWSEDILAIARARAAQGDLSGAIAAAELVPQNTPTYEPAQREIQRWQQQS